MLVIAAAADIVAALVTIVMLQRAANAVRRRLDRRSDRPVAGHFSHRTEEQGSAAGRYGDRVATTTLVKGARASRSTVALKILMAGSGVLFVLFVLFHMYGNLKMFQGHDYFNAYAHHLRTFGEPILPYGGLLWILRTVMIVSLVGARLVRDRAVEALPTTPAASSTSPSARPPRR